MFTVVELVRLGILLKFTTESWTLTDSLYTISPLTVNVMKILSPP